MTSMKKRNKGQGPRTLLDFGIISTKKRKCCLNDNTIASQCKDSRKPRSRKQSFFKRLEENVMSLGMIIRRDVPRDGNCFFHCVADQLERLGLDTHDHKQLRCQLVSSLRTLDVDDPLAEFCTPEYLADMSNTGTWVDAVAVRGMARILGRDIHIVTSQEGSTRQGHTINKILACDSSGPSSDSPLLLGHIGEQHYLSLDTALTTEPMVLPTYADVVKGIYSLPVTSPGIQSSPARSPDIELSEVRSADIESSPIRFADIESSPVKSSNMQSSPVRSEDIHSSPVRSSDLKLSPARSTDIESSSVRFSDIDSSPVKCPDMQSSPARSLDMQSSPARSPDMQSSPARSLDKQSSPARSPGMQSSPDWTLDMQTSPDRGLDMQSSPERTLDKQSSPARSMSSPAKSVDMQSSPDNSPYMQSSQYMQSSPVRSTGIQSCPLTASSPQGHFDVGEIIQGTVNRESLNNTTKSLYLSYHFTPPNNYKSFVTQIIVRGKMKQKKVLVFQHSWLKRYGWLVYSPAAAGGLCKYCILFGHSHDKRKYGGTLVTKPMVNMVKAIGKNGILQTHENSQYHRDAVQIGLQLIKHQNNPERSLPYLISKANQNVYQENVHILKAICEAIVLCGKQNLPLRGHRDDNTSTSSNKGNFMAILEMLAKRDSILRDHIRTGKKNARYTSKTIQNEVISIVGEYIRKENTRGLEDDNTFFSIMADEVTDPHSNQEILSVCLRMLNVDCKVKEFFFDFVYLERATGKNIADSIIHTLKSHNIDISKARGQAYDGAACMSSESVGVQAKINEVSPRALYVHCNSHVLNLSIAGACKLPGIRNMIDTVNSVFLFFNLSPKRQRFLERVLNKMSPEMKKKKLVGLCKTRWIERHTCYDVYYEMFGFLCECFEAILNPAEYPDIYQDTWNSNWDQETRTKAQGLLSNFTSFQYIIAFVIAKNALEHVRPMAAKLQKRDIDIYQAYNLIDRTKERIALMRQSIDEEYEAWYDDSSRLAKLVGTTISAPRKSNSLRQMHRANAASSTPKEYYLQNLAIPFCDHLSAEFERRFNSKNKKGVQILALLPASIIHAENVQTIIDNLLFWEADMPHVSGLRAEVKEWQRYWGEKEKTQLSSLNLVDCLQHADEDIFPNIRTLLRIGCTIPVGSCEAERSFSCLRRTKTYLRNNMCGERLSGLALMNMNHDINIDLDKVCEDFITRNKRRMFDNCILYQ